MCRAVPRDGVARPAEAGLPRASRARLAAVERRRAEAQILFVRLGSHELRTPITVARGYTELVRAAHSDPETLEDTEIVLDELAKLERITARLLTLLLIEGAPATSIVDLDQELQPYSPTLGADGRSGVARREPRGQRRHPHGPPRDCPGLPSGERGEVHRAGRRDQRACLEGARGDPHRGERHRRGHPGRRSAEGLRPLHHRSKAPATGPAPAWAFRSSERPWPPGAAPSRSRASSARARSS